MTWWHVLLSICVPLLILVLGGWALVCLWRVQEFEQDARAAFDDGESE